MTKSETNIGKKILRQKMKQKKFDAFCSDLINHEKMEEKAWYPVLKKDKELNKVIKHLISEEKSAADDHLPGKHRT